MSENSNIKDKKKLTIIGGGITGLVTAYLASKNQYKITLVETSKKFGGLLNTFEVGGEKIEHYSHDAELRWLLKDLDIENKLLFYNSTMGLYSKGKIYDFNSIKDLLKIRILSLKSKILFILTTIVLGKFLNWRNYETTPAISWLNKWAGKELTETIWAPLLKIKFGENYNKIPLAWMIGRVAQRLNSRKFGKEKLGYIDGSCNLILKEILKRLKRNKNVKLINNAKIKNFKVDKKKFKSIKVNNKVIEGGKILFTCPTQSITKIIKNNSQALSKKLKKINYLGACCVILIMKRKLSDIYWLNVAEKNLSFGGVIEHTNLVDAKKYKNNHIIYLSRYFDKKSSFAKKKDKDIIGNMIRDLQKVNKNFDKKNLIETFIFRSKHAAILNNLNFSKKIVSCKTDLENLFISNMMHIYPDERSINNSIRVSANACRSMGMKKVAVPTNQSLSAQIGFQN